MIRHRNRILLAVVCCPALFALSASGQITTTIQQQSPLTADSQKAITTAISGEVKAMAGGDGKARDKLVADCEGHGVTASHDYQAEYASDLVKELTPLLAASNPLRVRLNAAIVIGRAAERLMSAGVDDQFAATITTLLQDKEPALAIWGAKAAKFLVASMVQAGVNSDKLQDQILQTVKNVPDSGAIADEAYAAFTLAPLAGQNGVGQLAAQVLPHLTQLMDLRAAQYAGGTPASPIAERAVASFVPVIAAPAWRGNVPLRNDLLKSMGALTCAQVQAIANGNNDQELIDTTRQLGDALAVMGQQIPGTGTHLATAGNNIHSISVGTQPNALTERCNDLNQALSELGVTPAGGAAGSGAGTTPAAQTK